MGTSAPHTRPPWRIVSGRNGTLDIESETDMDTQGFYSGRRIAHIPCSLGDHIQLANARLIALAPRMLQFIQAGYCDKNEARSILSALTRLTVTRLT